MRHETAANGLLGFISLEADSELQTTALCLR